MSKNFGMAQYKYLSKTLCSRMVNNIRYFIIIKLINIFKANYKKDWSHAYRFKKR
jgi:hypothetical protein